ncbi:MAG: hypothetical protein HYU67_02360 [Flavobacteriia bacterium]|nr:hypothetical protein [Flavobacteriia bacterium]
MRKLYVLFNRTKISKEEIKSYENFDEILTRLSLSSTPIYKKPLFWGSAGLASLSLILLLSLTFQEKSFIKKEDKKSVDAKLPEDTECLEKKLEHLKDSAQTFILQPNKSALIELNSGSSIEVKSNSLILKDDSEIILKVKEYYSPSEVLISGINMDYKDKHAFESAGMIELHAYQNNKLVEINHDVPIKVQLKCTQDPNTFKFWKWNEQNKDWVLYPKSENKSLLNELKTLKNNAQKINENIEKSKEEINNQKEIEKADFKLSKNKQQFNIAYDVNDFPELEQLKNVVFEVSEEGDYDRNFTKKKWTSMDLVKEGKFYVMKLQNNAEKHQVKVRPILTGKDAIDAEKEFKKMLEKSIEEKKEKEKKLADYKKALKINETQQIKIENELNQIRKKEQNNSLTDNNLFNKRVIEVLNQSMTFETTTWGIFNCDNPIPYPPAFELESVFTSQNENLKIKQLFVFDTQKNLRYQYGTFNHPINTFGLFTNKEYKIILIDEGGKMYSTSYIISKTNKNIQFFELKQYKNELPLREWIKQILNEEKTAI